MLNLEELSEEQVSTIYFETQEELRSVAELYWAASARLHRVTGYTGLAEIFAAAPNATHRQQIRSWNIRLNHLRQRIDELNSEYADQQRVLASNAFQWDQTRLANFRNFHDRYPQDLHESQHDGVGALDIPPHGMQALSIPLLDANERRFHFGCSVFSGSANLVAVLQRADGPALFAGAHELVLFGWGGREVVSC